MISSNNLYHFTEEFSSLKSILKSLEEDTLEEQSTTKGIRVSYCLEDFSWLNKTILSSIRMPWVSSTPDEDLKIGIPMACFCDIPSNLIKIHSKVYGCYGIGLSQEWGAFQKLNPLFYLADQSSVSVLLQGINKQTAKLPEDKPEHVIRELFLKLLAYYKPYCGEFKKGDKAYSDYRFYDEREWRYVPPSVSFPPIPEGEFDEKDKKNEKCVEYLPFRSGDINVIVVTTPDEKKELVQLYPILKEKVKLYEDFCGQAQ